MKTLHRITAVAAVIACVTAVAASSQMSAGAGSQTAPAGAAKPIASPDAEAHVTLKGKILTIKYNSPQMRGRKVMGEIVPYGQVWRTGANPATSFVTAIDLRIGNLDVPAGSYTIYTLPAAPGAPWQLIINKQTGQWGTEYHQEQDLGRTPMETTKIATPQEGMSITFEKTSGGSTQLHVKWETADEWVPVTAK